MKNIHLIPTDNEQHSIIRKNTGLLLIQTPRKEYSGTKLNIYITSNEEIKEGDWFYSVRELIEKAIINYPKGENFGKIILTTDQFLIDNGVQAIDDEFLEWFVKNPSCESVEIVPMLSNNGRALYGYKIIIPKEEPKQYTSEELEGFEDFKKLIKPKQETLEEVATKVLDRKYPYHRPSDAGYWKDMFISGAKWMEEEMEKLKDFDTWKEWKNK
jgi:hypothetical protein